MKKFFFVSQVFYPDDVSTAGLFTQQQHPDAADDDRGEHDFQHGEIFEPKLVHNHVVVGHTAAMQQHAEGDAHGYGQPAGGFSRDREIHDRVKVWVIYLEALVPLRNITSAVRIPKTNIVRKKVQLLSANWSEPLMPCPLVQPPAIRAPNMMMTPPKKAAMSRFGVDLPNCCAQVAGTFSQRNVRLTSTLNKLPRNVPTRNNMPPSHLNGVLAQ